MNNKRLIALTISLILGIVPGLCVLSFASDEPGTSTEAEQHFEKANELRKAADYYAAITEYKKVMSLSPESKIAQNAQYWIGQSHFAAGQLDAASSAFQKLLDDYPASTVDSSIKQMIERVQQAKKIKSLSLVEAALKGDIDQVKLHLSLGADVNTKDKLEIALHPAASKGHTEIEDIAPFVSGLVGKEMLEDGDMEKGVLSAGQSMGLVRDIPTCQELFDRIMAEAEEIINAKFAQAIA